MVGSATMLRVLGWASAFARATCSWLSRPRPASRPRAAPASHGPSLRRDGSTGAGCPRCERPSCQREDQLSGAWRRGAESTVPARLREPELCSLSVRVHPEPRCCCSPCGGFGAGAGGDLPRVPAARARRPGTPPGFAAGRSPPARQPGLGTRPPPAARFLRARR